MIDFDEIVRTIRGYYKILIGALVVLVLVLCWWLFRGYSGRGQVGETLTDIKRDLVTNERRLETIIEAAQGKENEVRRDVAEKMGAVSDDDLPDILAGLLAEWRREHGR